MAPLQRPELTRLSEEFPALWRHWYPGAPPVGFLLRDAYPERWVRIHSLPDSKRYATSEPEHAELRRRHNAVASDVLGDGSACALVIHQACDTRWSRGLGRIAALTDGDLPRLGQLPSELWEDEGAVFDAPMCLFGGGVTWQPDVFDGFVGAVADDKVRGLIVELDRGGVYAPYDGGADLFYPTEVERDAARTCFALWLSPLPEGL